MNESRTVLSALLDQKAGLDDVIAEMNGQDWRPYLGSQVSRIPAIRKATSDIIATAAASLEALAQAGIDTDVNVALRTIGSSKAEVLRLIMQDAFDDHFEEEFAGMEEAEELERSRFERAENAADGKHQVRMEAAE